MSAIAIVRDGNMRLRVVPNPKWLGDQRFVDWDFRWRDGAGRRRRLNRALEKEAVREARRHRLLRNPSPCEAIQHRFKKC